MVHGLLLLLVPFRRAAGACDLSHHAGQGSGARPPARPPPPLGQEARQIVEDCVRRARRKAAIMHHKDVSLLLRVGRWVATPSTRCPRTALQYPPRAAVPPHELCRPAPWDRCCAAHRRPSPPRPVPQAIEQAEGELAALRDVTAANAALMGEVRATAAPQVRQGRPWVRAPARAVLRCAAALLPCSSGTVSVAWQLPAPVAPLRPPPRRPPAPAPLPARARQLRADAGGRGPGVPGRQPGGRERG